jgi:hypothetical protein
MSGGLSDAEIERVKADIRAKCARLPRPGPEKIARVAALLAAPRLRRAREEAARTQPEVDPTRR